MYPLINRLDNCAAFNVYLILSKTKAKFNFIRCVFLAHNFFKNSFDIL